MTTPAEPAAEAGIGAAPAPVPDVGIGPDPVPGQPDELRSRLVRVTAPNPGMMTGPGTNTYLVGAKDLAVIDPGPNDDVHLKAILAEATARDGVIRWVLVTHTHRDHAPLANRLAREVGAEVIGFEAREAFVPDRPVTDGWTLEGGDFILRAVHTPGHAGDHVCWYWPEHALLFTGDHVMHGSTVVIRPPDADMSTYLANLRRLLEFDASIEVIAPGHGRLIAEPALVIERIIEHRLAREVLVAAALAQAGSATIDELVPTVYADVDEARFPVARLSLWAHLRRLAELGRAQAPPGDDELTVIWTATPTT